MTVVSCCWNDQQMVLFELIWTQPWWNVFWSTPCIVSFFPAVIDRIPCFVEMNICCLIHYQVILLNFGLLSHVVFISPYLWVWSAQSCYSSYSIALSIKCVIQVATYHCDTVYWSNLCCYDLIVKYNLCDTVIWSNLCCYDLVVAYNYCDLVIYYI